MSWEWKHGQDTGEAEKWGVFVGFLCNKAMEWIGVLPKSVFTFLWRERGEETTHFWLNSSWHVFSREQSGGGVHWLAFWCSLPLVLGIKCRNTLRKLIQTKFKSSVHLYSQKRKSKKPTKQILTTATPLPPKKNKPPGLFFSLFSFWGKEVYFCPHYFPGDCSVEDFVCNSFLICDFLSKFK